MCVCVCVCVFVCMRAFVLCCVNAGRCVYVCSFVRAWSL